MNYFECYKCKSRYWEEADKVITCKICHSIDCVREVTLDLGKSISKDMTDEKLISEHYILHKLYKALRMQPRKVKSYKNVTMEEIIKKHVLIVTEMKNRKLGHSSKYQNGLDKSTDKLNEKRVDIKSLEVLQDWGDITLVEDIISVVGSTLSKDNPNDVDLTCKFTGVKVLEDAIKEIITKRNLKTHIIHGESHGEYVPKYDLVLKEKAIEKKDPINPPKYEFINLIQYGDKTWDTQKFVVEPYIKNAQRILISRKDGKVEIWLNKGRKFNMKSLEERINMIEEPKNLLLDGLLLKNGTLVLQDMIAKDNCNLTNDPLLSRKTFLIKTRIPRSANIAFIKFRYCKTQEEFLKTLQEYKSKEVSAVVKPAFGKYDKKAGWMKMGFAPLMKIDLGCGKNKKFGYIGMDKEKYDGVDVICDLEKGIPLEDGSCEIVRANHFIEHLSDPQFIMEEIYRVLCKDGTAILTVPEKNSYGSISHPDHKSFWDEFSFEYYSNPYFVEKFQTKCLFKIERQVKKIFSSSGIERVWICTKLKKMPLMFEKTISPKTTFLPPQPENSFDSFEEVCSWAKKYLNKGIAVEEVYKGIRMVVEYDGITSLIFNEHSRRDRSKDCQFLVDDLKKIGPVILDVVMMDENKVRALDILYYKGKDLTNMSFSKRREYLEKAIKGTSIIPSTISLHNSKESLAKVLSGDRMLKVLNSSYEFEKNSKWASTKGCESVVPAMTEEIRHPQTFIGQKPTKIRIRVPKKRKIRLE